MSYNLFQTAYSDHYEMKRQSAISAFFRPLSKRPREANVPQESSRHRPESSDSQEASTSGNDESDAPVADPVIDLVDENNRPKDLPTPFDSSTLPNVMPTHEGRTLQKEWFINFSWLRYNDDCTCHCSSCLWAVKNNRLSAKNTEGIQKSKWARTTVGWQDYRKGKAALRSHSRSSWHQAANDALQVRHNFPCIILQ